MVIAVDDFESLQMTRQLVADPGAVQDIMAADREIAAGESTRWTNCGPCWKERQRRGGGRGAERGKSSLRAGVRTLPAGPPREIPLNAAWAIFEFIRGPLSQDPWRVSKPFHDELGGFRGARRGEYRVIIRIEEEQRGSTSSG